jgi:hypothetical protein
VGAAAAFAAEQYAIGLGLLVAAYEEAVLFSTAAAAAINQAIACIRAFITSLGSGGTQMACQTTHSGGRVQGAGLCCAAVQAGALTPPPAGTTLPIYVKGSKGAGLPAGRVTQVTDSKGDCATCMIVGSKSTAHFGKPVLKFIRGGPGCPTGGSGCCAMVA